MKALVIKEFTVGEGDKYLALFTDKYGRIEVFAKKAKRSKTSVLSGTELFVYGNFIVEKIRDTYKLSNVEIIRSFYDLRKDIFTLSYASFIIEFLNEVLKENSTNRNLLKLALYTLNELPKKNLSENLVKCVFETRALKYLGYMPNVYGCVQCNKNIEELDTNKPYAFSIEMGGLLCEQCIQQLNLKYVYKLKAGTVYTFRHVLTAPFKQLYYFTAPDDLINEFCKVSDRFLRFYIDKDFKTLDFIRNL